MSGIMVRAEDTGGATAWTSSLRLPQCPDMSEGRAAQSLKVVTALERGDNLAAASMARDLQNRTGRPGEIIGLQRLVGQRIATVGVEPGGDQDQVRRESVERRHQATGKAGAP